MGHLVVPLKAVLSFYAQAANHPLPADLAAADGSTLDTNSQVITPASSYIMPDLRNKFLIGADRTGIVGDGGQYIAFISNITTSANSYDYQYFDYQHNYTITSGDYLTYDVYWPSANIPSSGGGCGAVDLYFTDGTVMRTLAPADQNGISSHPNSDLRAYALDQWYTRTISLSNYVGKVLSGVIFAHEYDSTFSNLTTRFRNIFITESTGLIPRYIAWAVGDGTPLYTPHAVSSATFVSGNATSLISPGPDGVIGGNKIAMKQRHIPVHNHTATSGSAGDHTHSTSVTGHGSHTHNPTSGTNFALSVNTTYARAGSTYRHVTCLMGSSGGAGNHTHTVSPANDGAHNHNVPITTASSGGINATAVPFDIRTRFTGVVWCIKTGIKSKRAQSIPLGTIIMWYADVINETLPVGFSDCNGSTLTNGNHIVPNQSGSTAYDLVLPNLRNSYLIGADRTKAFGNAGSLSNGYDGAPGSGYQGGIHGISIAVTNLPDHTHPASTDTQWSTHNHSFSVTANGNHTHGPAAGNLTSSDGTVEDQGISGDVIDEYKGSASFAPTSTTTNDSHNHTFSIGANGSHSHSITVNSNGSGSTWDNRIPFIGIVHLMKTNVGLLSVPLKTIVGFRSTVSSESIIPSDGTWAYCDGSTLTPGQFDMAANSGSNYVLPDFRNIYGLGADRTKAAGNGGGTTNVPTDAPGPKGTGGTTTVTFSTSTMPAHIHAGTTDAQGNHNHGGSASTSTDSGHAHSTGCHSQWVTTDGTIHHGGDITFSYSPPAVDTYSTVLASAVQPAHGTTASTTGAHTHTVTISNQGSASPMQQRPRSHGVVFCMKVKR